MAVRIILKEKPSGKPIEGASVRLESIHHVFADYTDADGLADFDGEEIPDGKYIVKIRSPHHRPYTEKHFISRNSLITSIKLHRAYD